MAEMYVANRSEATGGTEKLIYTPRGVQLSILITLLAGASLGLVGLVFEIGFRNGSGLLPWFGVLACAVIVLLVVNPAAWRAWIGLTGSSQGLYVAVSINGEEFVFIPWACIKEIKQGMAGVNWRGIEIVLVPADYDEALLKKIGARQVQDGTFNIGISSDCLNRKKIIARIQAVSSRSSSA